MGFRVGQEEDHLSAFVRHLKSDRHKQSAAMEEEQKRAAKASLLARLSKMEEEEDDGKKAPMKSESSFEKCSISVVSIALLKGSVIGKQNVFALW